MIDKIWKLNEFLFVDIYTNWGSWDQFVFYGGRMLPDFSHEMCRTTIMLQIWQCFWGKDCLNCEHWILIIAGFAEELAAIPVLMVVENGCGQPMYWFGQDADLIVLEGMGQLLCRNFNTHIEACCGESTLNP